MSAVTEGELEKKQNKTIPYPRNSLLAITEFQLKATQNDTVPKSAHSY